MSKNYFDKIEVPENIDLFIKEGIKKASYEKKHYKKRSVKNILIASISGIIIIGLINPALAAKIPLVGNIFEMIEKNLIFPSNYSQYSTSVNQVAKSNGISVTLKEVASDGFKLYVTYLVENEKAFKWTYTEEKYKHLDVAQLDTIEAYNKVSFTDKELPTWDITGLNGKFIDKNTFVGMHTYDLEGLGEEIPDEFDFQVKITSFMTNKQGVRMTFLNDTKRYNGTWAFKVPVKINRELSKKIDFKNDEQEEITLDSIVITPFETLLTVDYKDKKSIDEKGLELYEIKLYNEDNTEIRLKGGNTYEGEKKYFFNKVNENNKNIRAVLYKYSYKLADGKSNKSNIVDLDGTEYEKFEEKIFDKSIEIS